MSDETFTRPRVAVVGSCQVVGLAAAARRLLPGAEVKAWHVGVFPKDTDEEILAQLPGFDLVISQIPDWDEHVPLRIGRLLEHGLKAVYLPVLMFAGFHPDITYIRAPSGQMVHGLDTEYHSLIVAAAFTLGIQQQRVPALFNAYVFTELGYFEVFEAAKTALINNFRQADYDLEPLFGVWLQQAGQFMYTINHPHIRVLASLCRLALARAGRLDPAAPIPEDIDDALATHFIWPTYPALARRIGVSGSTTFLRNAHGAVAAENRELPLKDYISACYEIYGNLPKDALRLGDVVTACERLQRFVVS